MALITALLVAFAAASAWDRRAVAPVAAAPYVFPLVLYLAIGEYHVHYMAAWLAAMLGVVLPDALRRPWHVPSRWAAALSCWAGVVCVTAPIVFLRSTDLHWDLLTRGRLPHEALGGLTFQSLGWIGHVALLLVIGILWFDWLCGQDEAFFVRWIATPFALGAVVLAATSAYQMAVDIRAVNPTVYARLLRATGTLFDANVAGAAAALWTGGTVLYGLHALGRRWFMVLPASALVEAHPGVKVACLGLAFKANIDDFRESPARYVAASLARKFGSRINVVEPYAGQLPREFEGTGAVQIDLDTALEECGVLIVLVDHDVFKVVPLAICHGAP